MNEFDIMEEEYEDEYYEYENIAGPGYSGLEDSSTTKRKKVN